MKVAIAGAGIAGAYLARLLRQRGIVPDLFESGAGGTRCGCRSCGWGVPAGIRQHLAAAGLVPEDYLLDAMPSMQFDELVAPTPLCTIDKPRLLADLRRGSAPEHRSLGPEEAEAYDIVVDATGISRAFLPPCRADLTLPTLQHRVAVEERTGSRLPAGVYGNRVPGLGYVWVFPLGGNRYHIGAGGIGPMRLDRILDDFYADLDGNYTISPLCSCTGTIRVASPYYSLPHFARATDGSGNERTVIGTGESIGTVSPFTGEGIFYALESARLLADCWPDPERYSRAVLGRFGWMKKERETLDYLLMVGGKGGPRLRDRWRFYLNARRSGIGLPLPEAFRRIGTLSRWVGKPGRGT